MTNEENFAEKDSSTHKEKDVTNEMLCCQIVYLLLICVPFLHYYTTLHIIMPAFGFECTIEYIFFLLKGRSNFLIFMDLSFIILVTIYPIITLLSFCVFIWGYMTGNLHRHEVRLIHNLPFILNDY